MKRIVCPKCHGKGILPNYKHVEDGVCFLCYGSGSVTQEEYESYQMEGIKADNRRTKRIEAIENQRKQWEDNKKEKAIQRKEQKEQEEKERKSRDDFYKTHPEEVKKCQRELQAAIDNFFNMLDEE